MAEGKQTGRRKEQGEAGSGKAESVQKLGVLAAGWALLAGNSCSGARGQKDGKENKMCGVTGFPDCWAVSVGNAGREGERKSQGM